MPKNLKNQLLNFSNKINNSKDLDPLKIPLNKSNYGLQAKKLKTKAKSPNENQIWKDYKCKSSFGSPFNKKHDTSQISENEFIREVKAKLNFASIIENSKTIEELIKTPKEGTYLKWSASKGSSIRKKVGGRYFDLVI